MYVIMLGHVVEKKFYFFIYYALEIVWRRRSKDSENVVQLI